MNFQINIEKVASCATSTVSEDPALFYSYPHSPKREAVGICPSKGKFHSPVLSGQVNRAAALRHVLGGSDETPPF